ncbi:hypothetical protein ACFE04_018924 [Oxalis oulophora]
MDSMVIKVKYGDTLRRFNAPVDGDGELQLDMSGLNEKIYGLFNFPPESHLSLTYVDEDGDVVTLVDDDDLRDVMRQSLKFLRIDVQLKGADRSEKSDAKSSGTSTPLSTPQAQPDLSIFKTDVVLNNIPEPLREVVSDSIDLASTAASSNPRVADILDIFSKIGQSILNPVSQPTAVPDLTDVSPKFNTSEKTTKAADSANISKPEKQPVDLNSYPPCESATLSSEARDKKYANRFTGKSWGKSGWGKADCGIPSCNIPPLNNSISHVPSHGHGASPFKRSCSRIASPSGVFHRGVRCDGCGIHPITGPRYKSKVKEDYDLCNICFSEMGNEEEYIRIDQPISYRHSRSLRAHGHHPWALFPTSPHHVKSLLKPIREKLDSRFVMDVNVLDGTRVAPSSPFTKIWQMRNNGSIPWPQGVHLAWIGGDKFSDSIVAEVQIPVGGVPVDGELDIAVDFIAPAVPGRYISYWRMASPTGAKFGQRVWVLIQVDASMNKSLCDSFCELNLNFPPAGSGSSSRGPKTFDVNVKLPEMDNAGMSGTHSATVVETVNPVEPIIYELPKRDAELNFPINDSLLVGDAIAAASAPPESSSVTYPSIDIFDEIPAEPLNSNASPVNNNVEPSEVAEVEKSLLKELEQMGFRQTDLNKEVLRMNKYDLERSVDDLCGVTEWDPILEELMEMGFIDAETNKKLLKKNNGSIKRVVMDLLSGEKP